jgi:hypothetical protein
MQVISRLQSEPFRGREGLGGWMHEIDEQFQEWEVVGDEWRVSGDRVAVLGRGDTKRPSKPPGYGTGQVLTVRVGDQPLGCDGIFCERTWNWYVRPGITCTGRPF